MCEFVSWIKHNGAILFLEDKDFQGRTGKELKDYCRSRDDWPGHGAIRYVYGLDINVGENCECTDFSSPANFPAEIVKAIRCGRMTLFDTPELLLSEPALEQYGAVKKTALEQYEADVRKEFWTLFSVEENRASAWKKGKDGN